MSDDPKLLRSETPGDLSEVTVLVIDDDPAVVLSIEAVLETYHIHIVSARDGVEGLALFRDCNPAVVITDIVMPGQDGIGAIMQMRRERPHVKIVAMSGGGRIGHSDFLTIARRLGADHTIEKPFDAHDLATWIHQLPEPDRA